MLDQKEYHIYSLRDISVVTIAECIFEVAQKYNYGYSQNSLTSKDDVFIYIDKEEISGDEDEFDEESKILFSKK